MPTERRTVQQLAAEMYLRKRDRYAREIAARSGTPYESETVSDQRGYELYWLRDPKADEQRAWLEAASAVASGKLPPDKLASYVVEKVYPYRMAVTEGGGRISLDEKAAFVKRMVDRKAREEGKQPETVAETAEQAQPAPESEMY